MQVIRSGLGPLPFVKDKDEKDADASEEPEEAPTRAPAPASNRPAVLPDGSYATQVSGNSFLICSARLAKRLLSASSAFCIMSAVLRLIHQALMEWREECEQSSLEGLGMRANGGSRLIWSGGMGWQAVATYCSNALDAAQTALADTFSLPASLSTSAPNLRTLLLSGDFFLGGVIAGQALESSLITPASILELSPASTRAYLKCRRQIAIISIKAMRN